MEFIVTLFTMGIRFATVLTLAALGETFSQRSGVLNVGVEGYMSLATIVAFSASYYTGDPWLGILMGMAVGGILSLIHGYLSISLGLSQIVSGIGILFFAEGLMCFINLKVFQYLSMLPKVPFLEVINIPVLSRIRIIGPILFQHSLLIYITFLLVPLLWFILYRTKFGLKVRSVGESAGASDTMGVHVLRIRYTCTLLSGVMGGLAGGFLCLGVSRSFLANMVAGRGFVVLAAIVLGNWNPFYVFWACLLFGMVDAFQYKMQILKWGGVPYAFWLMLPYLVTIGTLVIVRKSRQPPELVIPFLREKKA